MDETKVQIGEEVLLDIGIHSEWYISSTGYDGESVDITLRKKADRIQKWWFSEEYSPDGKPCGLTLQSSDGRAVELVPAPKWIPCSERLPELTIHETDPYLGEWDNSEAVLVYNQDSKYECRHVIALYTNGFSDKFGHDYFGWVDVEECNEIQNVLAWMPLPEPYTADTPQTDLLVKTPRKSRESHEENCETCRDKDAYDEWQGNCDECENGSMYTPQTDEQRKVQEAEHRMAKIIADMDTPQTESTGSPIGDYRDGVGAWQMKGVDDEQS